MHADPSFELLIDTVIDGRHYAVALVDGEVQERTMDALTEVELLDLQVELFRDAVEDAEYKALMASDCPDDPFVPGRPMRPLDWTPSIP